MIDDDPFEPLDPEAGGSDWLTGLVLLILRLCLALVFAGILVALLGTSCAAVDGQAWSKVDADGTWRCELTEQGAEVCRSSEPPTGTILDPAFDPDRPEAYRWHGPAAR